MSTYNYYEKKSKKGLITVKKKTLGIIFIAGGLLSVAFLFPLLIEAKNSWQNHSPLQKHLCVIEDEKPDIKPKTLATVADYRIENDKVIFDFALVNYSSETKKLQFNSGQQFELIIRDEKNVEVYRYSEGKLFTQALIYKTIEPGGSLHWQDQWNMKNKEGTVVSAGSYQAEIKILVTEDNSVKKMEKSQFKTVVEFCLTGIDQCCV